MATTVQDIKNKLGKSYRYPDPAARDVHALVRNFNALKVRDLQNFVHSNGTKERLMSVAGTIPVKIRGSTYNIPIAIWLKNSHPQHYPIVYVTPTSGMGIQQSRYVDANGMVYLPYLTEWKNRTSDLTALVQILCATFQENCPVYSKPAQPQWQPPRPVQPPTSFQSPQPYPGFPPAQRQPPPQQQAYQGYSTPYPSQPSHMPTPYGSYPPQPPSTTSAAPPPYPMGPSAQFPQPPSSSLTAGPPSRPPLPSITTSVAMGTAAAAPVTSSMSAAEEQRQIEEAERIKRESMETAVKDRIRRHVTAALNEAEKEMSSLQKTQKELQDGSRKINEMMEDMENKQREVEKTIAMLQEKNTELESVLDYLKAQPEQVDIDEAVTATTPLYTQIVQLYAEENAIDDTVYYLGEALRRGVIELEVFLKHVRELSRKQFLARATIMKARSTAGLPPHGPSM